MRCFIAVDIEDDNVRNKLFNVAKNFDMNGVKIVEYENLHITLKFLGEINEKIVEEVIEALSRIYFKKFKVHIAELGAFPSLKNPRVIWAGIKEGFSELVQLYNLIENELLNSGLRFPKEDFHPHVTLLRIKDNKVVNQVMIRFNQFFNEDFGNFLVTHFSLKSSQLTPKGPIYSNVKIFQL
jgi:2''-5'' RNA ligase